MVQIEEIPTADLILFQYFIVKTSKVLIKKKHYPKKTFNKKFSTTVN